MGREVVKKFLKTDPSKQKTSVEKTNFLRCLYREGERVTQGTYGEQAL